MTPGSEALAEAMRVEQARIYGTTCREHHSDERAVELGDRRTAQRRRAGELSRRPVLTVVPQSRGVA